MLDANEESWYKSSSAVAGTATIARRMRLHGDGAVKLTDQLFLEHNTDTSRFSITLSQDLGTYANKELVLSWHISSS